MSGSAPTPSSPPLNPNAKEFTPGGSSRTRSGTGDELRPRRKRTGTGDAADPHTIVLKNLNSVLTAPEIFQFLTDQKCAPEEASGVYLHCDGNGVFRGTAFVKYASAEAVQKALAALGHTVEMSGRKVKVELQRKGRDSRQGLEADLSQDAVNLVQEMITAFMQSDLIEVTLPVSFDTKMRKYAHSLAERNGLAHITQGSENDGGKKCVFLSKLRPEGRNKMRTDSASSYSLEGSPMSTFASSPLMRFAATPGSPGSGFAGSPQNYASSPWQMPSSTDVAAWYAQLNANSPHLNATRITTPLNANSPAFYPAAMPTSEIPELQVLNLDDPTQRAAGPDGSKGFRRKRQGAETDEKSGQQQSGEKQSVLTACSSLAGAKS